LLKNAKGFGSKTEGGQILTSRKRGGPISTVKKGLPKKKQTEGSGEKGPTAGFIRDKARGM